MKNSKSQNWYSHKYSQRDQASEILSSKVFPLEPNKYTSEVSGNGLCFVNAAITAIFFAMEKRENLANFLENLQAFNSKENPSDKLNEAAQEIRGVLNKMNSEEDLTGQQSYYLINNPKVSLVLCEEFSKKIIEEVSKEMKSNFIDKSEEMFVIKKDKAELIIKNLEEADLRNVERFTLENPRTRAAKLKECNIELGEIDQSIHQTFFDTVSNIERSITAIKRGTTPDTLPQEMTDLINNEIFNLFGYDVLVTEDLNRKTAQEKAGHTKIELLLRGGHYSPILSSEIINKKISLEQNSQIPNQPNQNPSQIQYPEQLTGTSITQINRGNGAGGCCTIS